MNKAQPRKKIILAVISDLNTDQRIQKVAGSLQHQVGDVCVVCRDSGGPNPTFPFSVKRIKSVFNKGFLFYAWFNISLFLRLLFINSDIIVANDADTLLPAYYVAKIKGIKIVFNITV